MIVAVVNAIAYRSLKNTRLQRGLNPVRRPNQLSYEDTDHPISIHNLTAFGLCKEWCLTSASVSVFCKRNFAVVNCNPGNSVSVILETSPIAQG